MEVLERRDDGLPIKIRINNEVYESINEGMFLVELSKIRNIKLKEIPQGVTFHVVERFDKEKNTYQKILYSVLDTETLYGAPQNVWIRIFEFRPGKYLDIRYGGKKINPLTFLEAYFKALRSAPELDARIRREEEELWSYDLEEAEAYLSMQLDPELTLEDCVNEVRQIFRKIERVAFSMLSLPRKKSTGQPKRDKERRFVSRK